MAYALTIEVCPTSVPVLRALASLLLDPRLAATVRTVPTPCEPPGPGVLRIEPASVIQPLVSVLWGEDTVTPSSERRRHAMLGLNRAVLAAVRGDEAWRRSGAVLGHWTYGTPDRARPWVLVAPGANVDAATLERLTGLANPQAHFVRPCSAGDHREPVWWLPRRSVVASLLGHVDAVVAAPGPLAWDAVRIGVPLFERDDNAELPAQLAVGRLANVVPRVLASDGAFWRDIVSDLLAGKSAGWGTIPWLLRAREHPAFTRATPDVLGLSRWKRRFRKLQRDPRQFWADSVLFRYRRS